MFQIASGKRRKKNLIADHKLDYPASKLSRVSSPSGEPTAGNDPDIRAEIVFNGWSKTDLLRRGRPDACGCYAAKLGRIGVLVDVVEGKDPILVQGPFEADDSLEAITRHRFPFRPCFSAIVKNC